MKTTTHDPANCSTCTRQREEIARVRREETRTGAILLALAMAIMALLAYATNMAQSL